MIRGKELKSIRGIPLSYSTMSCMGYCRLVFVKAATNKWFDDAGCCHGQALIGVQEAAHTVPLNRCVPNS